MGSNGRYTSKLNQATLAFTALLFAGSLAQAAGNQSEINIRPANPKPNTAASAKDGTSNPDSAVSGNLKRKTVIGKIRDRIASLDVSLKADLLEAEIFEGVTTALRYRYEFEPSYNGSYHLRMDRWTLDNDINIGDKIAGGGDFQVGLNLKHGTEVLFVRPFEKKSDAIKAIPYPFWNLPFNADDISKKLEVGDFVSFTAEMNVILGASTLDIDQITSPAGIYTHYLVGGQFQVHLFRKDKDKVVMKLIAIRKDEKTLKFTAGFAKGHKILGLRIVDRRIEKWTNITEIFALELTKTKSNLLMADYTLDMRDSRVRDAYDGLISSLYEFNTIGIANPFESNAELADRMISDITPFETIYATERLRAQNQRTIERNFKGKNDIDENVRASYRFGALLFHISTETEYTENALTTVSAEEKPEYFRLHTFQRRNVNSWWFSYYKSESISRATLLFDADKDLKIKKTKDIVFEWDYRDKSLEADEFAMIRNAVKQAVPKSIHGKINWGDWEKVDDFGNARFLYRMVLSPDALEAVGGLGSGRVFGMLSKYLLTIPEPTSPSMDPLKDPAIQNFRQTVLEKYKADMLNIGHWLEQSFNPDLSKEERSRAFAELRFNPLFIEIGPGFLVSLLPEADLRKKVYFNISLTADDVKPVNFEYGVVPDRNLYQAADYIRSVLESRSTDLAVQLTK